MKRLFSLMIICCFICFVGTAVSTENAGKINLNSATKEQLVSAGINEKLVDGILELREENDEFVDMEELMDVDGMTTKLLRELKKKLYIEAVAGCNC